MKVFFSVTDETIKENCMETIDAMEKNGEIAFPSEQDKTEFADDLIECIILSAESHIHENYYLLKLTDPDYYEQETYDLARLYGYIVC